MSRFSIPGASAYSAESLCRPGLRPVALRRVIAIDQFNRRVLFAQYPDLQQRQSPGASLSPAPEIHLS